jgi:hypothetical protein
MRFSKYASLIWRFPERCVSGIGFALVGFQLLAFHLLTLHSVAFGQQPKVTEDQVKAAYLLISQNWRNGRAPPWRIVRLLW